MKERGNDKYFILIVRNVCELEMRATRFRAGQSQGHGIQVVVAVKDVVVG